MSSLPTSPHSHHGTVWFLPVISLHDTVSQVRACLSIWWERFRGTQKEDDRGPLIIQCSLVHILQLDSAVTDALPRVNAAGPIRAYFPITTPDNSTVVPRNVLYLDWWKSSGSALTTTISSLSTAGLSFSTWIDENRLDQPWPPPSHPSPLLAPHSLLALASPQLPPPLPLKKSINHYKNYSAIYRYRFLYPLLETKSFSQEES